MFQAQVNGQQASQFWGQGSAPDQHYVQNPGSGIGYGNITLVPGQATFQHLQNGLHSSPLPQAKHAAGWTIKNAGELRSQLNHSMDETSGAHDTIASVVADVAQLSFKVREQFEQFQQLSNDNYQDGAQRHREAESHQQAEKDYQNNCELLKNLEVNVGFLQGDNTKKDGEIAGLKHKVQKLDKAVREATNTLRDARLESNRSEGKYKAENNKLNVKYQEAMKLFEDVQGNCLSVQQSLESSKNEVKSLTADNSKLKLENKNLADDASKFKSRTDGLMKSNRGQRKEIKSDAETISKLDYELGVLKNDLSISLQDIKRKDNMLKHSRNEIGKSRVQVSELKGENRQLFRQCGEAQANVEQLERVVKNSDESTKNFKDARRLLIDMDADLTKKQKALETSEFCVKNAESKILELEAEIESKEASFHSLEERYYQARGKLDSEHEEVGRLKQVISEVKGERNELDGHLRDCTADIQELKEEVSNLKSELCRENSESIDKKDLQAQLANAMKALNNLGGDNRELAKELEDLMDENKGLKQECHKLQDGRESRTGLINRQDVTIERQKASLSQYKEMLEEVRQNSNILKSELVESNNRIQVAMAMVDDHGVNLDEALELVKGMAGNKEGDMEKLRQVLEILTSHSNECHELHEEFDSLKRNYDELASHQTPLRSHEDREYFGFRDMSSNRTGTRPVPRDMESTNDDGGPELEATDLSLRSSDLRGMESRFNSIKVRGDYGSLPSHTSTEPRGLNTRFNSLMQRGDKS